MPKCTRRDDDEDSPSSFSARSQDSIEETNHCGKKRVLKVPFSTTLEIPFELEAVSIRLNAIRWAMSSNQSC